jgi:hypothetical protein
MANLALSSQQKTLRAQSIIDYIDVGGAAGTLSIYDGTIPTTPDTAVTTQVLLAAVPCPFPFGTAANATLTGNSFAQYTTTEPAGTASWARLVNSNTDVIGDFTVGTIGSGSNIELQSVDFYTGVIVIINSFTINEV